MHSVKDRIKKERAKHGRHGIRGATKGLKKSNDHLQRKNEKKKKTREGYGAHDGHA